MVANVTEELHEKIPHRRVLPARIYDVVSFIALLIFLLIPSSEGSYQCGSNSTECSQKCKEFLGHLQGENKNIRAWRARHPYLGEWYRKNEVKVAVEIGIAYGGLSHFILENVPSITEYHGVDPFVGGYDQRDGMSSFFQSLGAGMSAVWAESMRFLFAPYGCRFRLHHGFSKEHAPDFADGSIDLVFIDGDHTFEGSSLDIQLWVPKVRVGGAVFFDDYTRFFPGVLKAVDTVIATNNLTLVKVGHNVMFIKPSYSLIL